MEYTPDINLTEVFQKFAAKAVEDFPQLKDKLVVLGPTGDFYGEALTQGMDTSLDDKRGMQKAIKENVGIAADASEGQIYKDGQIRGYAFNGAMYTPEGKKTFETIALGRIGIDNRTLSSSSEPFLREIQGVLEHELGHIVVQGGRAEDNSFVDTHKHPDSHRHESAADTFAFLRQLQRGESIDRSVEANAFSRSMQTVLLNETDHLTTPAVLAAHEMSKTMDLSKLSPQETANLASKIAAAHAPSAADMAEIKKIYAPVLETYKSKGFIGALEKTSDIMMADHGPHTKTVYDIGRSVMKPILDNRLDIMNNRIGIDDLRSGVLNLQGEKWDKVREGIKSKDTEYHQKKITAPEKTPEPKSRFVQTADLPPSVVRKHEQRAGKATGMADIAVSLAEGKYGVAAVSAGQQILLSPTTYKAASDLTKSIAPAAKLLGQVAKRLPLIGGLVTAGYVLYEVGSDVVDGEYGKAGAALVAGTAEALGNTVGFGVGDAARETVRGGVIAAAGEEYAVQKSGLRNLGERGIDIASKFVQGHEQVSEQKRLTQIPSKVGKKPSLLTP